MTIVGYSAGHPDDPAAEHWLAGPAVPSGVGYACTHLVRAPYPHVAVSLQLPSGVDAGALPAVPPELASAARQAAAEHRDRTAGRAVLFPGVDRLVGTLTVAELLALSAIDRIHVLGGPPAGPDALVQTRDFVRPHWEHGRLTLTVAPVAGGRLAPFEVPDPTGCCADH